MSIEEDRELASRMRDHAAICVRNAAKQKWQLDYTPTTIPALEELIDSVTPWATASEESRDGLVAVFGAYFGEVLVRNLGGRWQIETSFGMPAVVIGAGQHYPHAMVQKRWENGTEDGLAFKYTVLSELFPAPAAKRRRWRRETTWR